LDKSDNICITGTTNSTTGIATGGAYQPTFGDSSDAFIAKFNPSLSGNAQLAWGTYYGGDNYDYSYAIALDTNNNVYITGETVSADLPLSANTFDTTYSTQTVIGYGTAFIAEFNTTGSSLLWGTFYGNFNCPLPIYISPNISDDGIAIDKSGNVYITGLMMTGMCPLENMTTANTYQSTINAPDGADYSYVAKFNPNLSGTAQLIWGTYYGGTGSDGAASIALDTSNNVYITGETSSTDGIATSGAYKTIIGDTTTNAFVAKFSTNPVINVSITPNPNPATYCPGGSCTLTASGAITYTWSPSTGLSATTGSTVTADPTITTIYTVSGVGLNDSSGTSSIMVTVNSNPAITASPAPASYCTGGSSVLTASGGKTYTWSPATDLSATTGSTVTANPAVTTSYIVTGTNSSGCSATDTVTVTVNTILIITANANPSSYCSGESTVLTASGGTTYTWSPSTDLSATTGATVTASPTATTTYAVTGESSGGCSGDTEITVTVIPSPNTPTFHQHGDTLISSSVHDNQWYRNDSLLKN
ncbi:MAG TPA: SBBP repeat-containing protein, partial [Candidatus Saccharimonadales bacterium]